MEHIEIELSDPIISLFLELLAYNADHGEIWLTFPATKQPANVSKHQMIW